MAFNGYILLKKPRKRGGKGAMGVRVSMGSTSTRKMELGMKMMKKKGGCA